MKRIGLFAVVLTAAALAATPAAAQRQRGPGFGGFGGDQVFLLGQKSVQEELKLSEEQVKKVTELSEKQREGFAGLRDLKPEERQKKFEERTKANQTAVSEILKSEQLQRLKQISLQQRGSRALGDPAVAEALKLTDEQKDKVKAAQEESAKAFREAFQGGNREEARKKMEELRKSNEEKLNGLLTADQKAKLKELTGEPFKGEIRPFGRRPGNGTRQQKKS